MKTILFVYYKIILWWLVISYLCFTPSDDFENVNINIPHIDKIVHFVMFFILGVFIATVISIKKNRLHSIWLPLIAIIYGGVVEIIQFNYINSRSGDLIDWIADIIGLVVGIFLFPYIPKVFKNILIYK